MPPAPDDIVDALDDLQHDLGKYLRLPLAFLPKDAPPDAVRAAARKALFETRRAGPTVQDAQSIWDTFRVEIDGALDAFPTFQALAKAMERATAWGSTLREEHRPVERLDIEADFSAVGQAIRDLRDAFDAG